MQDRPKLGISICLLGENVRFDGGHQLDRYLTNVVGQFVDWVPVCPEVECGLSTPREALRLIGDPENPRCSGPGQFNTEQLRHYRRPLHRLSDSDGHLQLGAGKAGGKAAQQWLPVPGP